MSEQNKLYIPQSIMDNLSLLAKKQLSEMTELQQAEFVDSYRRKAKSTMCAGCLACIMLMWASGA